MVHRRNKENKQKPRERNMICQSRRRVIRSQAIPREGIYMIGESRTRGTTEHNKYDRRKEITLYTWL